MAEGRPPLDFAVNRFEADQNSFPPFADLDAKAVRQLGRALKTRYVNAGSIIFAQRRRFEARFFHRVGRVELEIAGQTSRLGRADMFGQVSILMKKRAPCRSACNRSKRRCSCWTWHSFGFF